MERAAFFAAIAVQEAQGRLRLHAARSTATRPRGMSEVDPERRRLRLRRLSRHRRALQAAGARDRPQEARGAAAPDPAARARARALRADLRVHLAERHRAPGGGAGADADQPLSVVGAARRGPAQEAVRPMNFGTFLLMQSPSARSSQEIYARGVEIAQAAESARLPQRLAGRAPLLDLRLPLAPGPARHLHRGQDDPAARRHRGHRGAAAPSAGHRRGDRHARPAGRRARRHRPRPRLPALRVRALRPRARRAAAQRWEESVDIILKAFEGKPFTYDGKLFKIPETTVFPQPLQQPHPPIWITAQSPDVGRGDRAPRLQRAHRRLRRADRAHGASSASSSTGWWPRSSRRQPLRSACSARSTSPTARPTRAPPPRRRAGTCA